MKAEFFGVPGSGKTTVAKLFDGVETLKQREGRIKYQKWKHDSINLKLRLIIFSALIVIRNPVLARDFVFDELFKVYSLKANVSVFVKSVMFLNSKGAVISDQGVVQHVINALAASDSKKNLVEIYLKKYERLFCRECCYVYFSIAPASALFRIKSRKGGTTKKYDLVDLAKSNVYINALQCMEEEKAIFEYVKSVMISNGYNVLTINAEDDAELKQGQLMKHFFKAELYE